MEYAPVAQMRFETALAELEQWVARMESGQLELEASIAAYQRGTELMQHCQRLLTEAEARITVLDAEGAREVDRNSLEATS